MEMRKDHIYHLIASALGMIAGYYLMYLLGCSFWPCVAGGVMFGLGLGLGKEIGDALAPGNKFDFSDLFADIVGLSAATVLILIIRFISERFGA